MRTTCYAASIGHSVWFSEDRGDTWLRARTNFGGVYNESRCWSVATHPARPGEVLSGTDQGLYRWDPAEKRWEYVPSPMDGLHIQQLAWSPHDPDVIYAGTRPGAVFRSADGGRRWTRCPLGNSNESHFINTPRVTSIHCDRKDPDEVWVTIEIDGVFRSRDGGRSWDRLTNGLLTEDVHNLVVVDADEAGAGPTRRILVSTEEGLHRSDDDGASFVPVPVPQTEHRYFRVMAARADRTGVVFLSVGDRPSGVTGSLLRSRDWGGTWEAVELPGHVNSTIWSIGTNAADPHFVLICTIFGQVWRSLDGGETWEKPRRELGELRMVTWAPTP